jgi:hypothetical protein
MVCAARFQLRIEESDGQSCARTVSLVWLPRRKSCKLHSICSLEGGIVDHANEDCLSSVDYSICQALCPGSHSSGIK